MKHLSSFSSPWGKSFTNKRYLHPPFSEQIITMWPNSMVMIGEINADTPHKWADTRDFGHGFACPDDSCGVVFTLSRKDDLNFRNHPGKNKIIYNNDAWSGKLMPLEICTYKTRRDGIPIHSLTKDLDLLRFHEEAFCDNERVPTAYIKVTLENRFGTSEKISLGIMARSGPEFLLTGCPDPDGYLPYEPSTEKLNADEMIRFEKKDTFLTDGTFKLYFDSALSPTERNEQLVCDITLEPYEKKSFTFALTRSEKTPLPYAKARREALCFWKSELGKAKNIPNKIGVEPLFYNFLAQLLQMFACPRGGTHTIIRQGAAQRYHWPEAKEVIRALSLTGGYQDYIDRALSHLFFDLQEKEGENKGRIHYDRVPWNSRSAAALEMLDSALYDNTDLYEKYIDNAMQAFFWMERERARSNDIEGAIAGLFPPGPPRRRKAPATKSVPQSSQG